MHSGAVCITERHRWRSSGMMHARLGLSHKKKNLRLKSAVTFRWLNTHVIKVMIYLKSCWVPVNNLSLFRAMGQDLCEYLHKNLKKGCDLLGWFKSFQTFFLPVVSSDRQSVSALYPRLEACMQHHCWVPLQEVIKEAEVEWWMDAGHTLLQFASLHRPAINVYCILTTIHFFPWPSPDIQWKNVSWSLPGAFNFHISLEKLHEYPVTFQMNVIFT